MHRRENLHGLGSGIDAEKFFINLENAFEFAVQNFARNVRDVEIHGGLPVDAQLFLINDAVNGSRSDVARNEVAVLRIPLLEEIKALVFRNAFCRTRVPGFLGNPHAAAFPARRFAHEAEFVFTGDRGGMDLNEFSVRVIDALLE